MKASISKRLIILIVTVTNVIYGFAQGPETSYFNQNTTSLPWADSRIKFRSGSSQKIGFIPVVNNLRAPIGTNNYSIDVSIEKPIVFIPSINHRNGYDNNPVEIKGRIVLYCYDFEIITGDKNAFINNITSLIEEGCCGIVLFSKDEENPTFNLSGLKFQLTEIPIIAVSTSNANLLLAASGYDTESIWEKFTIGVLPVVKEPICNLSIQFRGQFDYLKTSQCIIRFNGTNIDQESISQISANNENALKFIYKLFENLNPLKERQLITYFSDYDEKIFYTNHWGKGVATENNGIFSIYDNNSNDYALAVHELTHILFRKNWGGHCSFISEGIAMYAESKALKTNSCNSKTKDFLANGKLLPLGKLIKIEIGSDKEFTEMGYAASGSFVDFLINNWGIEKFLEFWKTDFEWEKVYGSNLINLEKRWKEWIVIRAENFN
jgi:hypothetical protein